MKRCPYGLWWTTAIFTTHHHSIHLRHYSVGWRDSHCNFIIPGDYCSIYLYSSLSFVLSISLITIWITGNVKGIWKLDKLDGNGIWRKGAEMMRTTCSTRMRRTGGMCTPSKGELFGTFGIRADNFWKYEGRYKSEFKGLIIISKWQLIANSVVRKFLLLVLYIVKAWPDTIPWILRIY